MSVPSAVAASIASWTALRTSSRASTSGPGEEMEASRGVVAPTMATERPSTCFRVHSTSVPASPGGVLRNCSSAGSPVTSRLDDTKRICESSNWLMK